MVDLSPCFTAVVKWKTNAAFDALGLAGGSSVLANAASAAAAAAERRPRAVRNLTYLAGEVRKAGLR